VGPGCIEQPELASAKTELPAPPQPATDADAPANPEAAGPVRLIETAKVATATARITAAATPTVARKREPAVGRLLPDDEDILPLPLSVTSMA
jgi:hypothetical protein